MTVIGWSAVLAGVIVTMIAVGLTFYLKDHEKANIIIVSTVSVSLTVILVVLAEIVENRRHERELLARTIPLISSRVWSAVVRDIAEFDQQLVSLGGVNQFEPLVHEPLRREIARSLQQAKNGDVIVRTLPETIELTTQLLNNAATRVVATSYIRSGDWWDSQVSRNYSDTVRIVATRVRPFSRIFILGNDDDVSATNRLASHQRSAGIMVSFVCASQLPPEERSDFIAIDGMVGAELELDRERRFQLAHFYPTTVRASDLERRFRLLELRAQNFPMQRPCSELHERELP